MPKPNPPLTPAPSNDLKGKEGAEAAPTFNLPPNALQDSERLSSATPSSANGSDSSYKPISPTSPRTHSRKPSAVHSTSVSTKNDFRLPPPPTRSRKIIQMKPREMNEQQDIVASVAESQQVNAKPQSGTSKKRQNNANASAAGRKIARKTAHSLIERRRRSKMNEEFDVLKNMIPACKGQEMHKLAILQASIEYMNYLEQCITDLKSQGKGQSAPQRQQSYSRAVQLEEADNDDDDEEMEDQDQDETAISTPSTAPQDHSDSRISLPSLSQLTSMTSPSTLSTGAARHYSVSSTSQASYSPYIHSNQTSPAFGPQLLNVSMINMPYSASKESFGLGSPALKALDSNSSSRELADASSKAADSRRRSSKSRRSEKELDREATAALLMLNHDRRDWSSSRTGEPAKGTNGMSVKDLLSG